MRQRIPLLVFGLAAACAMGLPATSAWAQTSAPHWAYRGHGDPAHWAELAPEFGTCSLGKEQSPIDIPSRGVTKLDPPKPIDFAYSSGEAEVANTGHTIQVNLPAAGSIRLDGQEYRLLQFPFHTPSEERFGGKRYPLVAHLVHKSAEGGLAVVAVPFKLGRENAALKPVFAAMPAKEGDKARLAAPFDPATLLPEQRAYYAFKGSLTTPPCSESVQWRVLNTPVTVSAAQLSAFRKLYPMNARPVQPLNGRRIEFSD